MGSKSGHDDPDYLAGMSFAWNSGQNTAVIAVVSEYVIAAERNR
jgi:hypothetical protein